MGYNIGAFVAVGSMVSIVAVVSLVSIGLRLYNTVIYGGVN